MTTAATDDSISFATQTPSEAAQHAQERMSGNARRLTFFFGTGVSFGMMAKGSNGQNLCKWKGMVEFLADSLPNDTPESQTVTNVLSGSDAEISTPILLGIAHMIRVKLVELGTWNTVVRDFGEELLSHEDGESRWGSFFKKLGECDSAPLLITTNYDLLVDRWLNALTLTNPKAWIPGGGSSPHFSFAGSESDLPVPGYLEDHEDPLLLWDMATEGLLRRRERFVHHLHGAVVDPDSVVFDPADYQRTLQLNLFAPIAELLSADDRVTVFAGVGAGMFDAHLVEMWKRLSKLRASNPPIYWLRSLADHENDETKILVAEYEELIRDCNICIVRGDGYDWMPNWLENLM